MAQIEPGRAYSRARAPSQFDDLSSSLACVAGSVWPAWQAVFGLRCRQSAKVRRREGRPARRSAPSPRDSCEALHDCPSSSTAGLIGAPFSLNSALHNTTPTPAPPSTQSQRSAHTVTLYSAALQLERSFRSVASRFNYRILCTSVCAIEESKGIVMTSTLTPTHARAPRPATAPPRAAADL